MQKDISQTSAENPQTAKSGAGSFKRVESNAIAQTKLFFSEDSPLKQSAEHGGRPYEKRIQQEQMAIAVSEALEQNHNLCVEAPTGVGKSFAYLIPAIYHALAIHKPVLISTETINLQEQLVLKDLPFLKKILNLEFTYVIAKGRSNYLCKRRLALAGGNRSQEFFSFPCKPEDLREIQDWASRTKDGSRSEIPFRVNPQLWHHVCSETASCSAKKCPYYHQCFYWKQRLLWDKADLVVTNHALFFIDLKIRKLEHQEST